MTYYNPYSYFGNSYAPNNQQYQPQFQPPVQNQQINDNPMIWVQGEAGAKAYPVAPNTTVVLWDSERTVIYIKRADANGVPTMRIFDYTERGGIPTNTAPVAQNVDYVTRKEFDEFKASMKKEVNDESAV